MLRLNFVGIVVSAPRSSYSNTTNVKVKLTSGNIQRAGRNNSNTTNVKVKRQFCPRRNRLVANSNTTNVKVKQR